MLEYIGKFEKVVYWALILMLGFVIVASLLELGWLVFTGIVIESAYRLENHELLSFFGFFLLVLIGIELLDTIKAYLRDNVIHVEIVILVAIIAISRKVILLDVPAPNDFSLVGYGVIIIALSGAYYLIKKCYTPPCGE